MCTHRDVLPPAPPVGTRLCCTVPSLTYVRAWLWLFLEPQGAHLENGCVAGFPGNLPSLAVCWTLCGPLGWSSPDKAGQGDASLGRGGMGDQGAARSRGSLGLSVASTQLGSALLGLPWDSGQCPLSEGTKGD